MSFSFIYYVLLYYVFFFNDTATTEIYTLSLHDALPICNDSGLMHVAAGVGRPVVALYGSSSPEHTPRSEEHTSELQSLRHLVCRLLLEKKKKHCNPRQLAWC